MYCFLLFSFISEFLMVLLLKQCHRFHMVCMWKHIDRLNPCNPVRSFRGEIAQVALLGFRITGNVNHFLGGKGNQ